MKKKSNQQALAGAGLPIHDVRPRFPKGELFLKNGARRVKMRGYYIHDKPVFTMSCIEYWESDDPDFGEPEQHYATYYPNVNEIDEMINALQEAKTFLNGAND